ncbi:hypothetical protein ACL02T_30490 [Pseudonocardia sp. RS010]|uniref:hypothetical protein n=1 Tax=Pseudonocardia sp. RS010 TaxID=3385979 RepID=UPI0039A1B59D
MTGFRPPSVAGVAGGVGTTTLALALHGRDSGTGAGLEADIVVCRSSAESLERAVRVADLLDPTAVPPVLAVTLDGGERRPPDRLDELGPGWAAVVVLPHVGRWRGVVDPYREAAGLLGRPRERIPRALRPYLDAVTRLARAVAESGRLTRPAPTTGARPGPPPASRPASPTPPALPEPVLAAPPSQPEPAAPTAPPRPGPTPMSLPATGLGFASYRTFVPVGADGPLTSVAVPRPSPVESPDPPGADVVAAGPSPALEAREPGPDRAITGPPITVCPPAVPHPPAVPRPVERTPAVERAIHPDLSPVRGIRILTVAAPPDTAGPRG